MNAVERTPPPPLEHPTPPCSICDESTDYDGGRFYCDHCGASWDGELSHLDGYSAWGDPSLQQCPATVRPYKGDVRYPRLAEVTYRCLLSERHDNQHRGTDGRDDEIHEWTDDDRDGYLAEVLVQARAGDILAEIHASAEALGIPAS